MRGIGKVQVLFAPEGIDGGSGVSGGAAPSSSAPGGGSVEASPSGADSSQSSPQSPQSSPVVTPSPSQPTPPATGAPAGDDNLSDVWGFDVPPGADDEVPLPAPQVAQPEARPVTPPVAAQVPPVAPPQPAAVKTEPPVQPTSAPSGPTEAMPPLSPAEPQRLAQQLTASREAIVNHLANTMFALSKEDLEALDGDAGAYVPKLLARTYFESQLNMLNFMSQSVPMMIRQQTAVMQKQMEAEQEFYAAHPNLNRAAHGQLVQQVAATWRQLNPHATRKQMIAAIGPMVAAMAGVQPAPAQQVATPGNIRPPQPTPFVPAPAGAMGSPPTNGQLSPWEVDPTQMDEG